MIQLVGICCITLTLVREFFSFGFPRGVIYVIAYYYNHRNVALQYFAQFYISDAGACRSGVPRAILVVST